MKSNIIIFGSSRSGKTTLANMINKKFNYNVISMDSIVSAFEKGMPELGITHASQDPLMSLKLKPFLNAYMGSLNNYNNRARNINYVIEGAYLSIEYYYEYPKYNKIVLVQDMPTALDFYNSLKNNDTEYDWTYSLSDDELMEYAKHIKKDNDRIIKYCKDNNIKYYNMAYNRKDVFEEILNTLEYDIYNGNQNVISNIAVHY